MRRSRVQAVAVVVLVAGEDARYAGSDYLREAMLREVGIAGVVQGVGEGPSETDALVKLADALDARERSRFRRLPQSWEKRPP